MAESDQTATWFVSHQGQRYGPYPAKTLADWIALGRVAKDSVVSNGGVWIGTDEFMQQQARENYTDSALPDLAPLDDPTNSSMTLAPPSLPAASTTIAAMVPQEEELEKINPDDSAPERDRIVVLGRTRSGKTIYLAELYHKLWRSLSGINAKAVTGEVHRYLMDVHQKLQQGDWPVPTQLGGQQIELEIEHAGKKRLMVTLDFSGETFRHAFVEEQTQFAGVKELTEHLDRAAAVLLLADPAIIAGPDYDAATDDDFGIVQAVHRIRNWPGGESVPVALVLTKMDQRQHLIDQFGGSKAFVRDHFPALVRLLKHVPIFLVSAVQTDPAADGKDIPRKDSQPVNLDAPLRFCLDVIDKTQEAEERKKTEEIQAQRQHELAEAERIRERRQNYLLAITLTIILGVGVIAAMLILFYRL
ncbi:MAG TPA: hypothetical protein VGG19_02430 [Tepidisphaeraceae bacterium]|jgi:hypothetical protein